MTPAAATVPPARAANSSARYSARCVVRSRAPSTRRCISSGIAPSTTRTIRARSSRSQLRRCRGRTWCPPWIRSLRHAVSVRNADPTIRPWVTSPLTSWAISWPRSAICCGGDAAAHSGHPIVRTRRRRKPIVPHDALTAESMTTKSGPRPAIWAATRSITAKSAGRSARRIGADDFTKRPNRGRTVHVMAASPVATSSPIGLGHVVAATTTAPSATTAEDRCTAVAATTVATRFRSHRGRSFGSRLTCSYSLVPRTCALCRARCAIQPACGPGGDGSTFQLHPGHHCTNPIADGMD